jgi:hypothetical protein
MAAANTDQNFYQNAARSLKADPKKSAVLGVLAITFASVIGRAVFNSAGKSLPAAARGMISRVDSNQTPQAMVATQRQSASFAELQKWSEAPVPPSVRNLFNVRIDYFPVDGSRTSQSGLGDEGFWSRLEKSMALQADSKDKRENLIANFRAQAGQLKLQSIMMGPQPRAMVNSELVGEGSVVAEFRVLKIEARRIIVEREGIKLEIQMR